MELDTTKHRFSIVVIKDTYNTYADRYLLRYVPSWDCDLFFSFRTQDVENERFIKTQLSNALHVERDSITLEYKSEELQTKYSQSGKEVKTYNHKFYLAAIADFPDILRADEFTIEDMKYKWLSIPKMLEDSRIREVNADMVQYVRDYVVRDYIG